MASGIVEGAASSAGDPNAHREEGDQDSRLSRLLGMFDERSRWITPLGKGLNFCDRELEAEFWKEHISSIASTVDAPLCLFGILRQAVLFLHFLRQGKHWAVTGVFGVFVPFAAVLSLMSYLQLNWYLKYRTPLLVVFRFYITFCGSIYMSYVPSPAESQTAVLHHLFGKATPVSMAILSVFHLPFRTHVVVQAVSLIYLILVATPAICESSFGGTGFASVMEGIGRWIDLIVAEAAGLISLDWTPLNRLQANSIPTNGQSSHYSSWFVVSFFHCFFTFLLPTAILYCVECAVRMQFVRNRVERYANNAGLWNDGLGALIHSKTTQIRLEAALMAFWFVILGVFMSWEIFRAWQDVADLCPSDF